MKEGLTSRDWFGKASAGLVLGFIVSLGLSGLLAWALGVSDTYMSTKGQVAMWVLAPLWAGILSFCFLFRSGPRAWAVLALLAAVIWAALWAGGRIG